MSVVDPIGRLTLRLLGGVRLEQAGSEIGAPRGATRRALAYLALQPDLGETRSRLAAMLWEDCDQSRALRNLRQLLYAARRELGPGGGVLIAEPDRVRLDARLVITDVEAILSTLEGGRVPDVLVRGGALSERLIADVDTSGELYGSWAAIARREVEARMRSALLAIARRADAADRGRAAEVLLCQDRGDEEAARLLIAEHARASNLGSALAVYRDLWDHLDAEYGQEPDAATQDLVARIKTAETPMPAAPAQSRCVIRVARPTVADGDQEATAVARFFRADLIASLARFREFAVIDAETMEAPGDYELRCAASVWEGQLSMSVHLSQTSDGTVLLGHRIGDPLPAWQARQSEITGGIAAVCQASISRGRLRQMERQSSDPRAVDLWIMGQTQFYQFRPRSWERARACYERCMAIDPDFSHGYWGLAQLLNSRHLAVPGALPDPDMLEEARCLANKAIALDPEDARAHLARAWSATMRREFDQAAVHYGLAQRCNPDDPWTPVSSACGTAFAGRTKEAADLATLSLGPDRVATPQALGFHATIRYLAGDYEGCVAAAADAGEILMNVAGWQAAALVRLGRIDAAAKAWRRLQSEAEKHWTAPGPATAEAVLSWFCRSFPIASEASRADLADAAGIAARHPH